MRVGLISGLKNAVSNANEPLSKVLRKENVFIPAAIAGFFILLIALTAASSRSNVYNTETEGASNSETASQQAEGDQELSAMVTGTDSDDNEDTNDADQQDVILKDTIEGSSNSIKLELSSTTSSTTGDEGGAETQTKLTVNGEPVELSRTGRARIDQKTEIEEDGYESETDTDIRIDFDGDGTFRVNVDTD